MLRPLLVYSAFAVGGIGSPISSWSPIVIQLRSSKKDKSGGGEQLLGTSVVFSLSNDPWCVKSNLRRDPNNLDLYLILDLY